MRSLWISLLLLALAAGTGPAHAASTDWKALAARYQAEVTRNPSSVDAHFYLAVVYAHEGRLLEGWEHLKRVDQLVGGEAGRAPAARRFIQTAQEWLRRSPGNVFALYCLAFAAYFANRKGMAMQAMRQAAVQEPRNAWTMGYVGFLHGEREEVDEAIAWWEAGVKADPRNAVLHYLLGLAYTRKGDLKRAGRHFVLAYRDRTLYEYVKGQRKL